MKIITEISKFTLLQIAIACLLIIPMSTNAAIYMKIEGVVGDVTADGYEGWIDVSHVQEGMTQNIEVGGVGGGTSGKVNISDTVISKVLDRTSPVLRQKLVGGKEIPSVIISLVRTGADKIEEYFRITLEEVYLTSVSMSGSGSDLPTESVSCAYNKVRWEYTPYDSKGGKGSPIVVGWDVAKNVPL